MLLYGVIPVTTVGKEKGKAFLSLLAGSSSSVVCPHHPELAATTTTLLAPDGRWPDGRLVFA